MVDLSNYPYPSYESSKAAGGILAAVIGISMIAWIFQSIQIRFTPRRPLILLLVSHLTVFVHLVLRAALSTENRNSRAGFTATSFLIVIGMRAIIIANYDFLTQVGNLKKWMTRAIAIGPVLVAVTSAILMAPANTSSYSADTRDRSFRLRQASSVMVLILTVAFYPIWFATKAMKHMTKLAIILLIISSISCLFVSIYLVITSVDVYYVGSNDQEFWFYVFQFTPIAIALLTWTILHPKRTLEPKPEPPSSPDESMKPISINI
ncbi:unnamed protein product [Rotaria socialis]|uniref:Uncharacterized protein n=1 Tax=Rotaria socialis TaxID=392032 RepID=A0A817Y3F8_9BILA|nr:unnamed protein product [Rotaria socialis]CAF3439183.1 unnamed protein product [Rotaria socialis]CAF3535614.1 unnamed protein product [Rotaria socialis]CAF3663996.1 unnamed protein product [Rotaria socialis]CAF4253013.1 unnamed protein product [Rotaria socialis]